LSVKIQGLLYDVELVAPGLHSDFAGQTFPEDLRILVSAAIHPQKQEEILIHEITHMFLIQEPMIMAREHAESEGLISRLAAILYETLTDNELLVDGWMDKLVDKRSEEVDASISSKSVVEKNDSNIGTIEYDSNEPLCGDSDDAKVLSRRQGNVGRHSQAGIHQRLTSRRRP